MAQFFQVGDVVDTKTGASGIVTSAWTNGFKQFFNVKTSMKTPPITYSAHELTLHVLASPDTVLVRDTHGIIWAIEVIDVNVTMTHFYFMNEGAMMMHPVDKIIQVIPASLARVSSLMGA